MEAVKKIQLIVSLLSALTLCVFVARAQHNAEEGQKLRMAQTYERASDYRNAARLYQDLYAGSPNSDTYFLGVVRSLSGLQQYEALVPMVEGRATSTQSPSLAVMAGTLNARTGKATEAGAWWKKAEAISNSDENILVLIGQDQIQLALYKDALETFLKARTANGDTLSYGDEIARLYSSTGDLTGAARESLNQYMSEGSISVVQKRLNVLLAYENGPDVIAKQLEGLSSSNVDILRLKQWFYRQIKDWQRALEITKSLEQISESQGQELLMFGDGARIEDQFDVAIAAYTLIMKNSSNQRFQISAAYGAVRALEEKLRRSLSMNVTEAKTLVERYDEIIGKYGKHPIAAEALYHSAILVDDVLKDANGAMDRLLQLQNQWRGTTVSADGSLRLADIYLSTGSDKEAQATLEIIANGPIVLVSDRKDLARLRLADLQFWSGNLDSARVLYQPLANSLGSVAANDALDRLLLLSLAQDDSLTVVNIAMTDGLYARRKYKQAADGYVHAARLAKDGHLRDQARMKAVISKVELNDDAGAEELINDILVGVPETIYGDRAFKALADIQLRRRDKVGAIQTLNLLLVNYPRSILVPTIRDQIRQLRGDA